MGFGQYQQHFILHEGPKDPAHAMLLAAGVFADQLHSEIWVFNQGYWDKDAKLWQEIQKASWEDVILEEDFKNAVKKDVYGFFDSETLYKEYSLPWKVSTWPRRECIQRTGALIAHPACNRSY